MNEIDTIIQELSVPLKTFRIFAIEKAIRAGKSPELLTALKNCLGQETDSECKLLLEHAIASIEERLDSSKPDGQDNEKILQNFALLKPSQQLTFIKKVSRKYLCAENSESRISRILETASHPVVAAELIRKCQQSWPPGQLDYLEKNLFSSSSVLQLACVEAIIQTSPEILQQNFEKLVLAPDPLLRALAIRGLARSFPESAAEFLADCLRKGDYYGRMAALRVCSVMPFELIKNSLLELLHSERDAKLLKICAAIVMSNPDKEIPYRLCEIIARGHSENSKFLQDLIKKCCEMIKLAELCDDFPRYIDSVQKYNRSVRARYLVLSFADAISQANDARKAELRKLFQEKAAAPEVLEAIEDLKKTRPAIIKTLAAESEAQSAAQSPETSASQKVETASVPPEKSLLQQLLQCQNGKIDQALEKIAQGFATQNSELVSAAFRAAMAVNDRRWLSRVKTAIKNENEDVAAAAFDYLAQFDPENFLLILRGFVNSPSLLIRTTLLRNVCRLSSEVARELLTSMLNDSQPGTRERALGSVIHFEFASIREILTDYLGHETNEELIDSCLSFFLTNPVLESVYDLKQLEQRKEFAQNFAKARESLISILDELKIANPEEVHQYIQSKAHKSADEASPQVDKGQKEKLNSIKSRVKWNKQPVVEPEKISYAKFAKLLVPALALIMLLFWFLRSDSGPEISRRKAINTVPLAGVVQDYSLVVQKIDSLDGALIGLRTDKSFIRAIPRPGKMFLLEPGDRIRLKGLPFKIAPDGTTIVKTISIKKEI